MGEVVNLRRARKAAGRRAKDEAAVAARANHGTPKAVRELADARRDIDARRLDGHRRESGPSDRS